MAGTATELCLRLYRKSHGLWYVSFMGIRSAFGRICAFVAVLGLLLTPVARPAMALATDVDAFPDVRAESGLGASMTTDEMPCCPAKPALPDCGKDCPFIGLCVGAALLGTPHVASIVPITPATIILPGGQIGLASIARAPPQRPPKA
jgi:hypothetical protein